MHRHVRQALQPPPRADHDAPALRRLGGTAADIAIQAENLAHTKQTIQRLIAEHTGQHAEKVAEDQRRDRWFTAEQAKEYGFVDRVVASIADLGDETARRFGFSTPAAAAGKEGGAA